MTQSPPNYWDAIKALVDAAQADTEDGEAIRNTLLKNDPAEVEDLLSTYNLDINDTNRIDLIKDMQGKKTGDTELSWWRY